MLVFRVEDENGIGPYQFEGDFSQRYEMMCAHANMAHPSPFGDKGLGFIDNDEFCGVSTQDGIRKWFKGFIRALTNDKFFVSVYESDSARVGRSGQVLFVRDDSTLVSRYTLTQLA